MGEVFANWPVVYLNYNAALKVNGFGSLTHYQRFNVLWKCYIKCLPVKSMLVHRGIAKVDQCEGCGSESETILHMLKDCAATKTFGKKQILTFAMTISSMLTCAPS